MRRSALFLALIALGADACLGQGSTPTVGTGYAGAVTLLGPCVRTGEGFLPEPQQPCPKIGDFVGRSWPLKPEDSPHKLVVPEGQPRTADKQIVIHQWPRAGERWPRDAEVVLILGPDPQQPPATPADGKPKPPTEEYIDVPPVARTRLRDGLEALRKDTKGWVISIWAPERQESISPDGLTEQDGSRIIQFQFPAGKVPSSADRRINLVVEAQPSKPWPTVKVEPVEGLTFPAAVRILGNRGLTVSVWGKGTQLTAGSIPAQLRTAKVFGQRPAQGIYPRNSFDSVELLPDSGDRRQAVPRLEGLTQEAVDAAKKSSVFTIEEAAVRPSDADIVIWQRPAPGTAAVPDETKVEYLIGRLGGPPSPPLPPEPRSCLQCPAPPDRVRGTQPAVLLAGGAAGGFGLAAGYFLARLALRPRRRDEERDNVTDSRGPAAAAASRYRARVTPDAAGVQETGGL